MASDFRIGGGVQDLPGAVPPRKHRLERNNLERMENEDSQDRVKAAGGKILFPMHVYKPGGLTKQVKDDSDLADAVAKGWKTPEQLHAGEVEEMKQDAEGHIERMTIADAIAFVAAHGDSAEALVKMRLAEEANGNRAKVIAAIAEAEDNFGAPGKAAKKGKR